MAAMGKNRKLRKAEFMMKTGLVGELKLTPNQTLQLHKMVDIYTSNKASMQHWQRSYKNIDGEYVGMSDSDIGEIFDNIERLRSHIFVQEERIKKGLKPTPQTPLPPAEAAVLPAAPPPIAVEQVAELAVEWYGG